MDHAEFIRADKSKRSILHIYESNLWITFTESYRHVRHGEIGVYYDIESKPLECLCDVLGIDFGSIPILLSRQIVIEMPIVDNDTPPSTRVSWLVFLES